MTKNVLFLTVLLSLAWKIKSDGGAGDNLMSLGDNRFVHVHEYQGRILVDIREYYQNKDGKLGPGKRGIALTPIQWATLKNIVGQIDVELDRIQKATPPKQGGPSGGNAGQDLPF